MNNKEIKEKIDKIYNLLKKQKGDPPSWFKIPMDPPSEEVKKERMMKKYMHINTGSVDTLDGWIADAGQEEIEQCLADRTLVQVVYADGHWQAMAYIDDMEKDHEHRQN